jgi:hypothetical protein
MLRALANDTPSTLCAHARGYPIRPKLKATNHASSALGLEDRGIELRDDPPTYSR